MIDQNTVLAIYFSFKDQRTTCECESESGLFDLQYTFNFIITISLIAIYLCKSRISFFLDRKNSENPI